MAGYAEGAIGVADRQPLQVQPGLQLVAARVTALGPAAEARRLLAALDNLFMH